MCVLFKRDSIGVLKVQCVQLYNSMSMLCLRHKCVYSVFQFQLQFDLVGLLAAVVPATAPTLISSSHFGQRISLELGV